MSIRKEHWQQVEAELKSSIASVRFKLGDDEISVRRVRTSESKTALAVYINGQIKGAELGLIKDVPELNQKVWRKRTKAKYSPKHKAQIIKIWGKRAAKKHYEDLEEQYVYFDPTFNTAASVVRQFKKLDGLKVVKVGLKTAEELAA